MKRILYITSLIIIASCSRDLFPETEGNTQVSFESARVIQPAASVDAHRLSPEATKALISTPTVAPMMVNVLRIDEKIGTGDSGLYEYDGWEKAYLLESEVSSAPSSETAGYLRTMSLNPVQTYNFKVSGQDTVFYHTRMLSWYPMTCPLHKNEDGKAVVTRFEDYRTTIDESAYSIEDGKVILNFQNLDGSKDVMVSNVVEGQHWHADDGTENYRLPFGQNDSKPEYENHMTYRHYLSAVKIYAYTENSDQVVSMWGAIKNVIVKNQPSALKVTLPVDMSSPEISGRVQQNVLSYGDAEFVDDVLIDFPLIKSPMYGPDVNNPDNQEVAEDSPMLEVGKHIYLGYALIKPNVDVGQTLDFDVHTSSGVLSLSVQMTQMEDDETTEYFQPGCIYTVNVNFNTEGAIADVVLKSGEEHYYDLSASADFGEEIHDYKYANCYVVYPEIMKRTDVDDYYDGYAFNATTVGNGRLGIYGTSGFDRKTEQISPVRASLLWESTPGLVTQVEYLYGYVRFKVHPPEVKVGESWVENGDYREGNAVIAVYDSQRKILWSWHIWVTDKPKDVVYEVNGNDVVLLDRNLGATHAGVPETDSTMLETYGLYYQWGRKDPSMGPKEIRYLPQSTETSSYYDYYGIMWNYAGIVNLAQPTVRDGVENPMYLLMPTDFSMTTYQYDWLYTNVDNLWGDYDHTATESTSNRQKTIYDPCPFGYMVPQDEISTLFSRNVNWISGKGMSVSDKQGNDSFFPFAGYKGVDKGVSSLSGAWRYVGKKGDYMSSKIESNGHRSRTYISDDYTWVEYGADSDNDGAGDASRTYNARVLTDDMANRRTAASVRCVKRENALNASLTASFIGDRTYAFVEDGDISFTYDVKVYGVDETIRSVKIEKYAGNENYDTVASIHEDVSLTSSQGKTSLSVPSDPGFARYRLVTTTSKGVVSRVGYVLRLFEISDLTVGGYDYSPSMACSYGQKYSMTFNLIGLESDFTVFVNGVEANKESTTTTEGIATIRYTVQAYIPGHINIQIRNADGGLACSKEYDVELNDVASFEINKAVYINNVSLIESGALYMIQTYNTIYSTYYYLTYDTTNKVFKLEAESTPSKNNVFLFHRDDTKGGGVSSSYRNVSAGAWRNMAAISGEHDGFIKEDLSAGNESEAAYFTCANGWGSATSRDIDMYLGTTGQFFYYRDDRQLYWGTDGNYYKWKWVIYPVTPQ